MFMKRYFRNYYVLCKFYSLLCVSLLCSFRCDRRVSYSQLVSLSVEHQIKSYSKRKQTGHKHVTDMKYNMKYNRTNQIRSLIRAKKKIDLSSLNNEKNTINYNKDENAKQWLYFYSLYCKLCDPPKLVQFITLATCNSLNLIKRSWFGKLLSRKFQCVKRGFDKYGVM